MQSFLQLNLLPKIDGSPEELINKVLCPLYENSTAVHLIISTANLEFITRLTWGFSHANIEELQWKITIAQSALSPNSPVEFNDRASSSVEYRLGALRYLHDEGLLSVKTVSEAIDFEAAIVFTDSKGIEISCEIHALQSADDNEIFRARLNWDIGSPDISKTPILSDLRNLSNAPSEQSHKNFVKFLTTIPKSKPSFEERFGKEENCSLLPNVTLYDHQTQAIQNWENAGYSGIYHMCTGAGKTIASLASVMHLKQKLQSEGKPTPTVIITVPKRMLGDQWCEIIEQLTREVPLKAYNTHTTWTSKFLEHMRLPPVGECPSFIVTTYASFKLDHFKKQMNVVLAGRREAILIADEMHNISSPSDRLAFEAFSDIFTYRIGLSATPEIEGNERATTFTHKYFNALLKENDDSSQKFHYCMRYDLEQGIREGVLCKYRYHPLPCHLSPDLSEQYLDVLKDLSSSKDSGTTFALYNKRREIMQKSMVPIDRLETQIEKWKVQGEAIRNTLVYCPPGNTKNVNAEVSDVSDDSAWTNLLNETTDRLESHGLHNGVIIGRTTEKQRQIVLTQFKSGDLHTLCAIGCLDEGIDIPSIRRAVVLYSVDRERQFVQRRGRILRKDKDSPDKIADIYDVILLPQNSHLPKGETENLLRKEMRRFEEFAKLAINCSESRETLDKALNIVINNKPI